MCVVPCFFGSEHVWALSVVSWALFRVIFKKTVSALALFVQWHALCIVGIRASCWPWHVIRLSIVDCDSLTCFRMVSAILKADR